MSDIKTKLEIWKIDAVRHFLQNSFKDMRVDESPKGHTAHLFQLHTQGGPFEGRKVAHQILLTRQFFDRFGDRTSLREALQSLDLLNRLRTARDRTVEIY